MHTYVTLPSIFELQIAWDINLPGDMHLFKQLHFKYTPRFSSDRSVEVEMHCHQNELSFISHCCEKRVLRIWIQRTVRNSRTALSFLPLPVRASCTGQRLLSSNAFQNNYISMGAITSGPLRGGALDITASISNTARVRWIRFRATLEHFSKHSISWEQ